jgi:hypothetical protein
LEGEVKMNLSRRIRQKPGGTVMIALGLLFSIIGAFDWAEALASSKWPSAAGTLEVSRARRSLISRRTANTWPDLRYRYQVNGREYVGNRLTAGRSRILGISFFGERKQHTDAILARYPAGRQVAVHYDPQQHSAAMLETGVNFAAFAKTLGGLVLIAAGALVVFGRLKMS